jgi:drug/metabolite transporter (DMT)-like permease
MFALAVLAALWAASTWAVASVYFARALGPDGRLTPAAATTFKNCLSLGAFLLLLPLAGGAWPEPGAAALLVLSGVLGFACGDALYFAALTRCGIQTAASVALLYVPLAALLDLVVYGETLSVWQLLGMAVTLLGVLLVVTDRGTFAAGAPLDPRVKRQGIWLSLGVVVVIACAVVLGHAESRTCGVFPMATLRMGGGVLGALPIALVLAARTGRVTTELARIAAPLRQASARPRALWIACALTVAGLVPYHFAMRELPGGVGAVLFATTPLFTLLLGRLSGESHGARGMFGTLIGFAGVALIVLST